MATSREEQEGCKANFDEIELTEVELNKLPARYRAWGKEISGKFQNHFISVSPPFLKFPYDDQKFHEYKLTIWNKTNRLLELDVEVPRCGVFQVFYNKGILFGGSTSIMIVRCETEDIQLCTDFIRIGIVGQTVKPLIIPLELFPSACWFSLPRIIVVPSLPIGKQIVTRITLPTPHSEGRYYFIIKVITELDCFSVSPDKGFLQSGSMDGVRTIIVKYTPLEYITQVYTFQIIFPEMPSFQPYEVNVYTRCVPNSESTGIRILTDQMEKLILKPKKEKALQLRLTFPLKCEEEDSNSNNFKDPDLLTHAGVMRFLSRQEGKTFEIRRSLGLHVAPQREPSIYTDKEKEFHANLNRIQIHQKNLILQHTRIILTKGSTSDEAEGEQEETLQQTIKQKEGEKRLLEYQMEMTLNDEDAFSNDSKKRKSKSKLRRCGSSRSPRSKGAKENFKKGAQPNESEIVSKQNENNSRWAKKTPRRRFIQAALLIITRRRANERIRKLHYLIEEVTFARQQQLLQQQNQSGSMDST